MQTNIEKKRKHVIYGKNNNIRTGKTIYIR